MIRFEIFHVLLNFDECLEMCWSRLIYELYIYNALSAICKEEFVQNIVKYYVMKAESIIPSRRMID